MEFKVIKITESDSEILYRLDPIPETDEERRGLVESLNSNVEIPNPFISDNLLARVKAVRNQFHYHWDVSTIEKVRDSSSFIASLKRSENKSTFF
jgi:hypothetical protein